MQSSLSLILAASTCLGFAAASPVNTDSSIASIETRAPANCTDSSAELRTVCWDELKIPDYIASWNRTTPSCAESGGDGSGCCWPPEPWTTCFLRLAYGSAGSDCSTIGSQECASNALSPGLGPSIAAKVGYVVRNILVINDLFTTYFQALSSQGDNIAGSDSTSTKLQQILGGSTGIGATLNNANVAKALVASLPFWGTPSVLAGGPQQINPHVNPAAAEAFAQSVQSTQALSSQWFGSPYDINDDMRTKEDLTRNLGEAGNLLQSALGLIMSDVPTFIAWAAHGVYSGSAISMGISPEGESLTSAFTTSMSIPPEGMGLEGLTSAFTTYLIGEALAQARFSATPASTTVTQEAFQSGRTCTVLGDVCKDGDGHAYYWSQAFQTQYQINEPRNWALRTQGRPDAMIKQLGYEASAYGLMQFIEASDAYMPVLFDGAYNCTFEGKAGGSTVNLNADGSLDVACLSAFPIYLAKGSSCPAGAVQVGGSCPFGFN